MKTKIGNTSALTQHMFEEHVYLLSNYSVARNPMFSNPDMQIYFIEKMEFYLSPVFNIISYSLNDHEFQIQVKLKKRSDFIKHFQTNKKNKDVPECDVPESTSIFSQVMANLQVSFVKHFNFVFERSGTMMAKRFGRELIESEEEMKNFILAHYAENRKHEYSGIWKNDVMNNCGLMTSKWFYEGA